MGRKNHKNKGKKASNGGGKQAGLREAAMNIFTKSPDKPLNYKQVAKRLEIEDQNDRNELQKVIHQLKMSGDLQEVSAGQYRVRRMPSPQLIGKVDLTAAGAAFVTVDGIDKDIYIEPRKVRQALQGDTVKLHVYARQKGSRIEGEIVEILQRAKETYVGVIKASKSFAFVIPDDPKMRVDFYVPLHELNGAKDGDKVIVKMTDWQERAHNPMGSVIMVLGRPGDMDVEMNSILAEFDFPLSFPKNVEEEAARIPDEITKEEIAKRRDMRSVTTLTIDPDDAKDFDDAISVRKMENGNWEIGIHIADVSHYVRPDTALDKEAISRATSVYLVDRTIPMLPEKLSNMVCSLRPNEEKLVFSAIFEMDDKATVLNDWFGRCVINSDNRFTYDEAQAIIEGGEGPLKDEVLNLHGLAKHLREARFKNGAIAFEKEEVKFRMDDKGNPTELFIKQYKDANKLVEEFMLLANKRVAEFIGKPRKGGQPKTFVYRIHDNPSQEKLELLVSIAAQFDYKVQLGPRKILTDSLNKLLSDIKGKGEENMLSTLAIRSMAKAVYSTENIGHFGLGFSHYSHFTSPIRRYPDVMAHRLLQRYLDEGASANAKDYEDLCKHSSEMEKKASDAERASTKYMQAKWMADKVGEEFEGLISGVTEWGIFVEIKENKCEGMIRLRDLSDDFYSFDEDTMTVTGSTTGNEYRLGDEVRIRVKEVSVEKRQIDLVMLG
jgi:ribonuclease R